jgi:hypothetical protein
MGFNLAFKGLNNYFPGMALYMGDVNFIPTHERANISKSFLKQVRCVLVFFHYN